MTEKSKNTDPQDGFDLIEYPCEFNFKAMCRANDQVPASDYIRSIVEPMVPAKDWISMSSNTSRTGKFESVTTVIRIYDRDQLELIYKAIAAAERVVMTL